MFRRREEIGITLVVLFAMVSFVRAFDYYSPLSFYEKVNKFKRLPSDEVTRYEARFKCLEGMLDPGEIVGFISTAIPPEGKEYYYYRLTQYVLSPVTVEDSVNHQTVVGYFPERDSLLKITINLKIIQDCRNGVVLLNNKDYQ